MSGTWSKSNRHFLTSSMTSVVFWTDTNCWSKPTRIWRSATRSLKISRRHLSKALISTRKINGRRSCSWTMTSLRTISVSKRLRSSTLTSAPSPRKLNLKSSAGCQNLLKFSWPSTILSRNASTDNSKIKMVNQTIKPSFVMPSNTMTLSRRTTIISTTDIHMQRNNCKLSTIMPRTSKKS